MFEWNRQYPCPTDKAVIGIYKDYLVFKRGIIDSWKKGVSNGLIGERDYKDLEDVRLNVKWGNKGLTPVFSLKPVIGDETTKQLEKYHSFFGTYMCLRDRVLNVLVDTNPYPRASSTQQFINNHINILTILILSWEVEAYKQEYFDVIIGHYNSFSLADFYERISSVENLGGKYFISDNSGKYVSIINSHLVGSFYRYTRKMNKLSKFDDLEISYLNTTECQS